MIQVTKEAAEEIIKNQRTEITSLREQLAAYKESNENWMNGFKELNTEVSKLKDREKKMLTTLEECSTPNAGYLARQILNELKGNG